TTDYDPAVDHALLVLGDREQLRGRTAFFSVSSHTRGRCATIHHPAWPCIISVFTVFQLFVKFLRVFWRKPIPMPVKLRFRRRRSRRELRKGVEFHRAILHLSLI